MTGKLLGDCTKALAKEAHVDVQGQKHVWPGPSRVGSADIRWARGEGAGITSASQCQENSNVHI